MLNQHGKLSRWVGIMVDLYPIGCSLVQYLGWFHGLRMEISKRSYLSWSPTSTCLFVNCKESCVYLGCFWNRSDDFIRFLWGTHFCHSHPWFHLRVKLVSRGLHYLLFLSKWCRSVVIGKTKCRKHVFSFALWIQTFSSYCFFHYCC